MYYCWNLITADCIITYSTTVTFVGCNFRVCAVAMLVTVGLLTTFHTYEYKYVCVCVCVFHHTKFHPLSYAGPLRILSDVPRFLAPGNLETFKKS